MEKLLPLKRLPLPHRTSVLGIGTEDTTFTFSRPQDTVAMYTLIEMLTGVFRHFHILSPAADRACQNRPSHDFCTHTASEFLTAKYFSTASASFPTSAVSTFPAGSPVSSSISRIA